MATQFEFQQCSRVLLNWSGGTAPYTVLVATQNSEIDVIADDVWKTSVPWTINLITGMNATLRVRDVIGAVVGVHTLTVSASQDSSCLQASTFTVSTSSSSPVPSSTTSSQTTSSELSSSQTMTSTSEDSSLISQSPSTTLAQPSVTEEINFTTVAAQVRTSNKISAGPIVGGVIGGLTVCLALFYICCGLFSKRRKSSMYSVQESRPGKKFTLPGSGNGSKDSRVGLVAAKDQRIDRIELTDEERDKEEKRRAALV